MNSKSTLADKLIRAVKHQSAIIVAVMFVGICVAALAAMSDHPKFTATSSVLLVARPVNAETLASSTPVASNDLPSIAYGTSVVSRLRSDLQSSLSIDSLASALKAFVAPDSNIMELQFTSPNANQAIVGVNYFADETAHSYQELATARFDSLIADFKSQLATKRRELLRLDASVASVGRQYPYLDVRSQAQGQTSPSSVYERLASLVAERDELKATLRADMALAQSTKQLISDAAPVAGNDIVQKNPLYNSVQSQYAKDEAQLKHLNAYGSDRYPGLIELRRMVAREALTVNAALKQAKLAGLSTNPSYAAALDTQARAQGQVMADNARIEADTKTLESLHAQMSTTGLATTAAQLHRDHEHAEIAYGIIANRLANAVANRSEAASTSSVVVLNRAQYASTSKVGSGKIAAVAVFALSVWLALTLAMAIDGRQERFGDRRSIEILYGAPVIGSVA